MSIEYLLGKKTKRTILGMANKYRTDKLVNEIIDEIENYKPSKNIDELAKEVVWEIENEISFVEDYNNNIKVLENELSEECSKKHNLELLRCLGKWTYNERRKYEEHNKRIKLLLQYREMKRNEVAFLNNHLKIKINKYIQYII
jgi:hypothetical protein